MKEKRNLSACAFVALVELRKLHVLRTYECKHGIENIVDCLLLAFPKYSNY